MQRISVVGNSGSGKSRIARAQAADTGWVIDGNYSSVRPLVWARADTVAWVDPPRAVVMRRLLWRTLRRGASRQPLWNGNRESLRNLLSRDPDRNIALWAWTGHAKYRARYGAAAADPAYRSLTFVRIGSDDDARRLLESAG